MIVSMLIICGETGSVNSFGGGLKQNCRKIGAIQL